MLRKLLLLIGLLLVLPVIAQAQDGTPSDSTPQGESAVESRYAGRSDLPAPEFPTGLDWINVPAPLTIESLRGKIVILDFWTYGCINCIHMIPTLQRLEDKYGSALLVIGVHSAKFANEGETQNIRQIVQRYGLAHPVINDSDFRVWQTYGVNAWPTFVVVDPRGNVLAMQAGEIPFEAFDRLLNGMIDYFDSTGELIRDPLDLTLEGANQPAGLLAFPGKVLADEAGGRLFIADSNHNRIIVANLDTYEVTDVIGGGAAGLSDGAFDAAAFDKPQGLALRDNMLYVADMENHAIRAVDLDARTVTTVAGTGSQLYGRAVPATITPALETDLSSPWDVAFGDADTLYVAMAGTHQIWALHVSEGLIEPLIGDGSEGLINDQFETSALAQPSGLYYLDGVLYFADSESSTIRAADTNTRELHVVAGTPDNNLFDFGDVDGAVGVSRLQHPLGITGGANGILYVADTYNSRIKAINPATNVITTIAGAGEGGGFHDGRGSDAEVDEPGGVSAAGNRLFIADTNNGAIRVLDLATQEMSTILFPNPEMLQISDQTTVIGGNSAQDETITLPQQTVAPGESAIAVRILLPNGYKINPDAPSRSEWNNSGDAIDIPEAERAQGFAAAEFSLPVTLTEGSDTLYGVVTTYYCEAVRETLCFIDEVNVEVPITVSAAASTTEIRVERTITPPQVDVGGF